MRAAAILGLGSSMHDLRPFQAESTEWVMGLPSDPANLDAILVFGGDGTVHRHLSALVKLGLPVLVVPAGSGNDFARALGLLRVRDSLEAWRKFVSGSSNGRRIDLGLITPLAAGSGAQQRAFDGPGRPPLPFEGAPARAVYFSCTAVVGLDGEISRLVITEPPCPQAHGLYALDLPSA